jgi:hypothetical protein
MGDTFHLVPSNASRGGAWRRLATPVALAAAIVFTLAGPAAAGPTRRAVAPTNTALPAITGTPTVGQMLTADTGTWTGTTPITFAYAWKQCDAVGGACKDVPNNTT